MVKRDDLACSGVARIVRVADVIVCQFDSEGKVRATEGEMRLFLLVKTMMVDHLNQGVREVTKKP